MNESKIVLPQSVANAIAHYVALADTKTEALLDITRLGYEAEKSEIILRHFDDDIDELMEALICGYEVEKSPEERIAEYYEGLVDTCNDPLNDRETRVLTAFESTGIFNTLELLGIKIAGVNA